MGQSVTPAMTVTLVTSAQSISLRPSSTKSETPAMGVGLAGASQTIELFPD